MNFAVDYIYRLAPRGGAGLACDAAGVALGATDLARVHLEGARRRCEVRPPGEIGRVLKAAYGPQPDAVVQRLHRGLNRTAKWLEAGDLCHAGVEAVMLGFPDLTPTAMAKLAELADLEKRGAAWEDEPRVPAGQAGGGQWTTGGGGGGGAAASAKPVQTVTSLPTSKPMPRPEPRTQTLDEHAYGPAAALPPSSRHSQQPQATLDDGVLHFTEGQGPGGQPAIWDDGVYRPASNRPRLIPASGPLELALDRLKAEAAAARAEAEAPEARAAAAAEAEAEAAEARAAAQQRSSRLPGEVKTVEQLFTKPKNYRGGMIPMGRPGRFGPAAAAETLSAEQSWDIYKQLLDETKAIDPHYANAPAHPKSAFIHLPLAERQDMIDDALLDRAAADYKIRGNPKLLQVETVSFLRKTVDHYYAEAVKKFDAKRFESPLARGQAIGNDVDEQTRRDLKRLYTQKGIPYGRGQGIAINNRDYNTSQPVKSPSGRPPYRVPDLRIGEAPKDDDPIGKVKINNITIDWTISMKQPNDSQIRDFIHADSKPKAVVIVVPSPIYPPGAYYIPSPAALKGN
jgi:hypothetical protein